MKRLIIITIAILMLPIGLFSQETSVVFSSDNAMKIDIYKPIDGKDNSSDIFNRIELMPDRPVNYKLDIEDFCFLTLINSAGRRYFLILETGDSVGMEFRGDMVIFKGDNAEGHRFNNDNFLGNYMFATDSVFTEGIKDGLDLGLIRQGLNNMYDDYAGRVDSIPSAGDGFRGILKKNFFYAINGTAVKNFRLLLSGGKMIVLPAEEQSSIRQFTDSLYRSYPPDTPDIQKYNYSYRYVGEYYTALYKNMTNVERKDLLGSWDKETFGPYASWLLAPDHIRMASLGSAFLVQIEYMADEFDKEKMLAYLSHNYPQSEYLAIVKAKMYSKPDSTVSAVSAVFIDRSIDSFTELADINGIKGNYIYIDLWATWCIPCKAEFAHNNDLYDLFETLGNIVPVYISIDDERLEKVWQKNVAEFDLQGFNLRASQGLESYIKEHVFKNEAVSIPRYILLDTEGNIIDRNMPRPGAIDEIKKRLDKYRL